MRLDWIFLPRENPCAKFYIIIIIIIPTRLYACQKTLTDMTGEVTCRLCNKAPESVAHVLTGCTALAQNKYITRNNAALKILFFEILQDLKVL